MVNFLQERLTYQLLIPNDPVSPPCSSKRTFNLHSLIRRERLADDKLCEISACVSPTQAKKYAIKPVIPETYHQPDAL